MPYGTRAPSFQHHLPAYCAGLLFPQVPPGERCCGDRECVTGDHLPIQGLRYPGGFLPRPGDPDGVLLLTFGYSVVLLDTAGTARGPAGCVLLDLHVRQFVSAVPLRLLATRKTVTRQRANVYCRRDRFPPGPGSGILPPPTRPAAVSPSSPAVSASPSPPASARSSADAPAPHPTSAVSLVVGRKRRPWIPLGAASPVPGGPVAGRRHRPPARRRPPLTEVAPWAPVATGGRVTSP